jgi:hypothetical protein
VLSVFGSHLGRRRNVGRCDLPRFLYQPNPEFPMRATRTKLVSPDAYTPILIPAFFSHRG